jgi:pimeloyl-ACP methyl ester carboxylesterase
VLQALADGQIFADRTGTGPVQVVGLHGWARDRSDLVAALTGFDALNVDLPGFGSSPPPAAATGASGYARVLAEALDGAGTGPVVLIGHSFGGRVAVALAAARPDLVRALVLTGVPLLRPEGPARKPKLSVRLARALHRRGLVNDARLEALRQKHGSDDYRRATGVMRDVLVTVVNESYEDELRALTCPVALVWGEDDTAAPLAIAQRAQSILAEGILVTLPGVGHDVPRHHPEVLHDAAARWLQSAPRA